MESKYKVVIVDDHDMFRAGVKVLLGKSDKLEIVGEASNGADFLKLLEMVNPDVVLMDISMPVMDGIETTRQALKLKPAIKILTLSMFGEEEYYYKMIHAGVHGFVLKSSGINELEKAILEVGRGSSFFSEELLRFVLINIDAGKEAEQNNTFTQEEVNILKFFTQNKSDDDISKELNTTIDRVRDIHKSLIQKTGSNNTAGLIMYAIRNKIVSL